MTVAVFVKSSVLFHFQTGFSEKFGARRNLIRIFLAGNRLENNSAQKLCKPHHRIEKFRS
jgi:hypothetical protein